MLAFSIAISTNMHIREASQKLFTTFLCIYTQFCLRLYSSLHACVQYVHFLVARVITSLHTSFFFIFHLDFPQILLNMKKRSGPITFQVERRYQERKESFNLTRACLISLPMVLFLLLSPTFSFSFSHYEIQHGQSFS